MFRVPLLPRQLQTNVPINGSVGGDLSDGGGGGGLSRYFSISIKKGIGFLLFSGDELSLSCFTLLRGKGHIIDSLSFF